MTVTWTANIHIVTTVVVITWTNNSEKSCITITVSVLNFSANNNHFDKFSFLQLYLKKLNAMLICYESKPKIVICCTPFAGTTSMLMHWPNLTHPIVTLYHLFTFVVLVSINRE